MEKLILLLVENIYVQPASSDNGTALGAACLCAVEHGHKIEKIMPHAYWGPDYSDKDIETALCEAKLPFTKPDNLAQYLALDLQKGNIIGWMQGRSEIGARALGGRSILANPLIKEMRDKLNLSVKHREAWRPFCPSMTVEDFETYFGHTKPADHMIIAYTIKEEFQNLLPSAVHVDGSVRPQTVRRETNPRYHELLSEFGKLTGHPILINTSFNIQGEPIVETYDDATRTFRRTEIDYLYIEDYLAWKPEGEASDRELPLRTEIHDGAYQELIDQYANRAVLTEVINSITLDDGKSAGEVCHEMGLLKAR